MRFERGARASKKRDILMSFNSLLMRFDRPEAGGRPEGRGAFNSLLMRFIQVRRGMVVMHTRALSILSS